MKKIMFALFFFGFLISGFSQANSGRLVLGDISSKPAKKIARFSPLADYLKERLSAYNISDVDIRISNSSASMVRLFENNEVDIYFDSVYPAMKVVKGTGAEILLRRWKDGIADYNSIIFSNVDSGIKTLDDLKGKIIAFEDVNSSSGYMLPYTHIKSRGYELERVKSLDAKTDPDKISFYFAKNDKNILQWVLEGKIPAGVIDSKEFLKIPEPSIVKFNVIDETRSVPRQVVVFRKGLDNKLKQEIVKIFKNMNKDINGKRVLHRFKNTLKFDDISGSGPGFNKELLEMYNLMEKE